MGSEAILVFVVIAAAIIAVLIVLALFLRDLALWYFKINERIELERRQNELLAKIAGEPVQSEPTSAQPSSSRPR